MRRKSQILAFTLAVLFSLSCGLLTSRTSDITMTASSQATLAAQQVATQVSITQEAQFQITQQAEFDQKCKSPELQTSQDSVIHLFEIDFWPEFDRPSMLVIYKITLSSRVSLPTDLTFRIPSIAGEPNAVAIQDSNGNLYNAEYSRTVHNEWADISLTTSSAKFQLEYYDPNLIIDDHSRHFEYQFQNDYSVDNLFIRVQKPAKAWDMQISPEMYGPGILADGMSYYCLHVATTQPSMPFITIDYEVDSSP